MGMHAVEGALVACPDGAFSRSDDRRKSSSDRTYVLSTIAQRSGPSGMDGSTFDATLFRLIKYLYTLLPALVAVGIAKGYGQSDTLRSVGRVTDEGCTNDTTIMFRATSAVKRISADVPGRDTIPALRRPLKVRGQVEIGGGYGPLPYSVNEGRLWNAYTRGEVGLDLMGVPLKVAFDVGTDKPQRGPRDRIRLMVDHERLLERSRWGQADSLQGVREKLDSLKEVRAAMRRTLNGIAFERSRPSMDGVPGGVPFPSVPADSLPSVPDAVPRGASVGSGKLDSLRLRAMDLERSLKEIEQRIAELEMLEQRHTGVVNASQQGEPFFQGMLSGIKRLEVGSCSPGRSEFLFNGVDMQGVAIQYERNNVILSLDHGRVLDEAWRATDVTSARLRRLNESLFLADVNDLSARRLTVVRAGLGTFAGSHVIIGYLGGRRNILPQGVLMSDPLGGREVNQVLEADMAYAIGESHTVRMVVASSILDIRGSAEEGTEQPTTSDLFRVDEGTEHAAKLIWSSSLADIGMSIEAEGRTVSKAFQSFGLGFLRSGAKAVEIRASQRLGRKVRLRLRGTREVREGTGAARGSTMSRGQLRADYRASRHLTLRASATPVVVVSPTGEEDATSASMLAGLGGDLRKRWGGWSGTLSADVGRYGWRGGDGPVQHATHITTGLGIGDDRWSGRVGWTSLIDPSDSTASNAEDLSVQVDRECTNGAHFSGSIHFTANEHPGWTMTALFSISKSFSVSLLAESYPRSIFVFNYMDSSKLDDTYHCSVGLLFKW